MKFLIIDDHPLYLEALEATIAAAFPEANIGHAETVDDAEGILATSHHETDLVIMDLRMPNKSGFEGLWQFKGLYPKLPIVMISRVNDTGIVEHARAGGASGFIHKSSRRTDIVEAIREVLAGNTWFPDHLPAETVDIASQEAPGQSELQARIRSLTTQQFRVLQLICDGKLNKQIAYELGVEMTTVKAHTSGILRKLNVQSRTQAVLLVQEIKLNEQRLTGGPGRGQSN